MQVLLVWELSPERVDFYLLPSSVAPEWIEDVNNRLINAVGSGPVMDKLSALSAAVDDEWEQYKASTPLRIEGPVTVVHSGFIL